MSTTPLPPQTGAQLIASSLRSLHVDVIFGIVGIPVIEVAEACIAAGIRFISFRNEQSASYAASAHGYLSGRPGVCLVVGGPGVLHAMAGVGNSMANTAFPLLLLAGSAPTTDSATKLSFQQLDQVAVLAPHTKLALRPPSVDQIPESLRDAYRAAFYGRPGAAYVDLPADFIQSPVSFPPLLPPPVPSPPAVLADPSRVAVIASLLRTSQRPLVILGKGAAYSRADCAIQSFVTAHQLPFLPTPQAKGLLPDSSPLNASAARSFALKQADFVLLLGARLNWILHFGTHFDRSANVAQVDISVEELGRNGLDPSLSVVADIGSAVSQLAAVLTPFSHPPTSQWRESLSAAMESNTKKAHLLETTPTPPNELLSYQRAFHLIQSTLQSLATSPEHLVYVAEGANTMDVSRSSFTSSLPRRRLDAGSYATMGVGLGYAVAAATFYPPPARVIAIEGDSAAGFSLAEIETMSRYRLPIIIVIMNNGGVYHGLGEEVEEWEADERREGMRLPSTGLNWETEYDVVARGLGGRGWKVRSEEELTKAVREAWGYEQGPSVLNVVMRSGKGGKLSFKWMEDEGGKGKAKL